MLRIALALCLCLLTASTLGVAFHTTVPTEDKLVNRDGRRSMPFAKLLTPERFAGTVQEVLPAGPYAYVAVQQQGATRWVATLGQVVEVGSEVVVTAYGRRVDFVSRRLDRTFSSLDFGRVAKVEPPSPTGTNP